MFDASVLPNGDLELRIDGDEQDELRRILASEGEGYPRALNEVVGMMRELGFERIAPEWIGALTSAPIFGEDVVYGADDIGDLKVEVDGRIWWFPDYMVRDEMQELAEAGRVTFTLAPTVD